MNQKMVLSSTSWWWASTSLSWSELLMPLTSPWRISSCCVRTNEDLWSHSHPCQSRTWNRNLLRRSKTRGKRLMKVKNFQNSAEHCHTTVVVLSYLLTVLETEPPALVAARACRLEGFWLGLDSVLESRSPDSRLNDVVQLSYTAPSLRSNTDISDSEVSSNVVIFHQTALRSICLHDWLTVLGFVLAFSCRMEHAFLMALPSSSTSVYDGGSNISFTERS